jgi:ribosome-associated translation inhibitor RaiA
MRTSQLMQTTDIETVTRGPIADQDEIVGYARDKVIEAARYSRDPILHARITLCQAGDPAVARPAHAKAGLEVDGHFLRAHVAAATMREAVDALYDRLRHRLDRLAEHWQARRGGTPVPAPHEWRHASEPAHRPGYYPRPVEQREIVRHKTYELHRITPDDAVYDMEALDYDVHLFTDETTGQDAVVYRAGPTGYRLARLEPTRTPEPPGQLPLTASQHPAPRLTDREAVDRINLTGQPFLFFADAHTGRGRLLYHRYDGHYGLITPA